MTRPGIIRADTIDLQDQHSPSAQDHSRQPTHPAPLGIGPAAPHQQSAIRQVEQERAEEENWETNGHMLRDDSGSDDESTVVHNGHDRRDEVSARQQNGDLSASQDDGELADAEVDDGMDDDMMDKMSSSPSIDDGGYSVSSNTILPRQDRCTTPPRQIRTSSLPCNASPDGGDSSPFLSSPVHLPLGMLSRRSRNASLEDVRSSASSSMYESSPKHLPLSSDRRTMDYRGYGEYGQARTTAPMTRNTRLGIASSSSSAEPFLDDESQDVLTPLISERLVSAFNKQLENMDMPSESELKDSDIHDLLLPAQDPLLDNSFDNQRPLSPRPLPDPPHHPSPTGSSDEWDTDSDDSATWSDEDDDSETREIFFSADPRFVDTGWGGECLQDTEDIDFEFVYALHTFVATVEGQANAHKGDTMVLLDDSNSYWWLVRIVKDSSIGYLPAEHIETPTERLARLNKHRNIDLSATMLGDTAEKTKNPLKKAMRRRNAKNVTFAPPTFVEASDYEYSSDEEEGQDPEKAMQANAEQEQEAQAQKTESEDRKDDENMAVEPLKVNGSRKDSKVDGSERPDASRENAKADVEQTRTSEEFFDKPLDPKVSRNGTMRNTDSFFKDDSTETRKITLTPNLLRDDSSTSTARSSDTRERGPSLDSLLEKDNASVKSKDDKRKKEKKPGMLSGLFKRKDKKTKGSVDDYGDEKVSEELSRSSMEPKESTELHTERSENDFSEKPSRQSSKGKLQKPPKSNGDTSPKKSLTPIRTDGPEEQRRRSEAVTKSNGQQATSTMRMVSRDDDAQGVQEPSKDSRSTSAADNNWDRKGSNPTSPKISTSTNPFADSQEVQHRADSRTAPDHLSESPVQVSPVDASEPPALVLDNSSQEEPVSPSSSPSLIDMPIESTSTEETVTQEQHVHPPPPTRPAPSPKSMNLSPSPTPTGPVWSDAHLRTYMDHSTDIRDLLLVVHDKSGVVPVGANHPIMAGLFEKETKKIKELDTSLDSLLGDWLERKRRTAASSASSHR